MVSTTELRKLLSQMGYNERLKCYEGLDPIRKLLGADSTGSILRFLSQEFPNLAGRTRDGVAFALAERYLTTGDLSSLRLLFAIDDAGVKANVLNALWGDSGPDPAMGPGIVQLAIDATKHPSPEVRTEACSVIQNQCGWKVDVSQAVLPLQELLSDPSDRVRQQAACAVGNLARRRYDLSQHVAPLSRNLTCEEPYVRNYSAWALWQLSRAKNDIGAAVPNLVQMLIGRSEGNTPRGNAIRALLHHVKRSTESRQQVEEILKFTAIDREDRQIRRFLDQLASAK